MISQNGTYGELAAEFAAGWQLEPKPDLEWGDALSRERADGAP
jgi:hypothetical protein